MRRGGEVGWEGFPQGRRGAAKTPMTPIGRGLEVKRPRTFEVTPKPNMDWAVQPLHLRNRRHLRLNDLPVLG